ncbi:MAG: hypothetical protein M2R46_04836 [Verrucomicrobia subdivision 3 bacterium]|nr:hypothetical protein [Limisphaerales bacterium]
MGGYTNGIVCERLAPGVRKELREKNLSSSKRPAQAQTSSMLHAGDVGHPKLKERLIGAIDRHGFPISIPLLPPRGVEKPPAQMGINHAVREIRLHGPSQ